MKQSENVDRPTKAGLPPVQTPHNLSPGGDHMVVHRPREDCLSIIEQSAVKLKLQ